GRARGVGWSQLRRAPARRAHHPGACPMALLTRLASTAALGALVALHVAAPAAILALPGSAATPADRPRTMRAPSAAQYDIVDLGTLGGPGSQARALNARGQVVGDASRKDGQSHAFVYGGDRPVDLSVAGSISVARGVNASGQVTGFAYDGGYQAFLWSGGKA